MFARGVGFADEFACVVVGAGFAQLYPVDVLCLLCYLPFAVVGKAGAAAFVGDLTQFADAIGAVVVCVGNGQIRRAVPAFAGFAVQQVVADAMDVAVGIGDADLITRTIVLVSGCPSVRNAHIVGVVEVAACTIYPNKAVSGIVAIGMLPVVDDVAVGVILIIRCADLCQSV